MAGDGYEVFTGGKAEDVDKFIRRIELTALKCNRDDGAFKDALSRALKEEFGRVDNQEDLWRELSKLHQGEQEDINVYVNRQVGNEGNVNGNAPPLQVQGQVQQGHNQAQVPPQFNVGILEAVHEVDEDDEVDVFANKRTRTQRSESEGHVKEERARAKLRRDEDKGKAPMEEGESSKQAKARAKRRKI
ncbi:hypothetical protein L7F22_057666, partial [Adiantum nelumboides]|nr:hypothetical protein [Adiantum nelumboides]